MPVAQLRPGRAHIIHGHSMTATWYVAQTAPRLEDRAERGLKELGLDAYCPRLTKWAIRARKKVAVREPLFPRYLFVQARTDADVYGIKRTDGVLSLLSRDGRPWPISGKTVEDIFARQALGHFDRTAKPRARFKEGQSVRLTTGAFAGFTATVLREKPGKRIEILFSILGGERVMRVDPAEVEVA